MHFLPHCSVVMVKGLTYPLMITDWGAEVRDWPKWFEFFYKYLWNDWQRRVALTSKKGRGVWYDYYGCPWPTGYILDKDNPRIQEKALQRFPFNHEDIEAVLFIAPARKTQILQDEDFFAEEFRHEFPLPIHSYYDRSYVHEIVAREFTLTTNSDYNFENFKNSEGLLPLGSCVNTKNEEQRTDPDFDLSVTALRPPYFERGRDYEVFVTVLGWGEEFEECSYLMSNNQIVEIRYLGYITAEVQQIMDDPSLLDEFIDYTVNGDWYINRE